MYTSFIGLWRSKSLPPYHHLARQAWRVRNGDPVRRAVIARLFAAVCVLTVIGIVSMAVIVLAAPDFVRSYRLAMGIVLVPLFIGAVGGLFASIHFGMPSGQFFSYWREAIDLLQTNPWCFAAHEEIQKDATRKLRALAQIVQEAEKQYSNPADTQRTVPMMAFERAYQVFLSLGLIRNDGYDRYFPKLVKTLLVTVHGAGDSSFGVRMLGREPRPWQGQMRDNLYEMIGCYVVLNEKATGIQVRWDLQDDQTQSYVARLYLRGGNPLNK